MSALIARTDRLIPSGFVTTGHAARALHVTRQGVRYLVDEGYLSCVRVDRLRLLKASDVEGLAAKRTHAWLTGRLPARQTLGPRGAPRQLSLFVTRVK